MEDHSSAKDPDEGPLHKHPTTRTWVLAMRWIGHNWSTLVTNLIAAVALFIAIQTRTDNKQGLDDQREKSKLDLLQLKSDLGMTSKDSVIFYRNSQITVRDRHIKNLGIENDSLKAFINELRDGGAQARMKLYGQMDSIMALKAPQLDSIQVENLKTRIAFLEQQIRSVDSSNMTSNYFTWSRAIYDREQFMSMKMYHNEFRIKEMQKRLLQAERERCPR